jgi:uncharacterized membrane protein
MMKKLALLSFFTCFFSYDAISCISCNRAIQKGIYNSMFYPNLLIMLSAFIVLAIIIAVLFRLATKRYNSRMAADPSFKVPAATPLTSAAMVLGIGIGGFIDGIVLHQILQFHEMLTNKLPADTLVNKSINMFWDGIFHLFTLITTIIGVYLLWRLLRKVNINRSGYLLTGGLLSGWGLFNLVEGIIDHQILKLHNVNEYAMNPELWNVGFLIFGVLLLLIGWIYIRKGERQWS